MQDAIYFKNNTTQDGLPTFQKLNPADKGVDDQYNLNDTSSPGIIINSWKFSCLMDLMLLRNEISINFFSKASFL